MKSNGNWLHGLPNNLVMTSRTKVTIVVALLSLPLRCRGGVIWRQGVSAGPVFYYYDFLGGLASPYLDFHYLQ